MFPQAREDGLLVEELSDETLVYDLERHKAHCLNRTAAFIWQHCDGQTSVSDLTRLLQQSLDETAGEEHVWLALDRLADASLLRERVRDENLNVSRRRLIKELGRLGVAIPVVTSIVSPVAAQGQTGISQGECSADPAGNEGKCCTNNRRCRSTGQCNGAPC